MLKIPQTRTHINPSKCLLLLYELLQNAVQQTQQHGQFSAAPPVTGRSPFAGVHLFSLRALLAFNVAAPTHLALAGPGHLPALGVVAAPAADGVAVFVLVALPGRRA